MLLVLMALTGWGMDNAPRATNSPVAIGIAISLFGLIIMPLMAPLSGGTWHLAPGTWHLAPGGSVRHSCRPHSSYHAGPSPYHVPGFRPMEWRRRSQGKGGHRTRTAATCYILLTNCKVFKRFSCQTVAYPFILRFCAY